MGAGEAMIEELRRMGSEELLGWFGANGATTWLEERLQRSPAVAKPSKQVLLGHAATLLDVAGEEKARQSGLLEAKLGEATGITDGDDCNAQAAKEPSVVGRTSAHGGRSSTGKGRTGSTSVVGQVATTATGTPGAAPLTPARSPKSAPAMSEPAGLAAAVPTTPTRQSAEPVAASAEAGQAMPCGTPPTVVAVAPALEAQGADDEVVLDSTEDVSARGLKSVDQMQTPIRFGDFGDEPLADGEPGDIGGLMPCAVDAATALRLGDSRGDAEESSFHNTNSSCSSDGAGAAVNAGGAILAPDGVGGGAGGGKGCGGMAGTGAGGMHKGGGGDGHSTDAVGTGPSLRDEPTSAQPPVPCIQLQAHSGIQVPNPHAMMGMLASQYMCAARASSGSSPACGAGAAAGPMQPTMHGALMPRVQSMTMPSGPQVVMVAVPVPVAADGTPLPTSGMMMPVQVATAMDCFGGLSPGGPVPPGSFGSSPMNGCMTFTAPAAFHGSPAFCGPTTPGGDDTPGRK